MKTPSLVIFPLICRSAEQETPKPTGQDAPCPGRRITRTSWQKYFPLNCAPNPSSSSSRPYFQKYLLMSKIQCQMLCFVFAVQRKSLYLSLISVRRYDKRQYDKKLHWGKVENTNIAPFTASSLSITNRKRPFENSKVEASGPMSSTK